MFDLPATVHDLVLSAYYKSLAIVLYSCGGVEVAGLIFAAILHTISSDHVQ
jgi:hypothetical protein